MLAHRLGRVAQAVDGDFDGDGANDVLVAEFGWRTTGRILLLRRTGNTTGIPQFEQQELDPRHGTSHLLPLDWEGDGDGDVDLAAGAFSNPAAKDWVTVWWNEGRP